MTSNGRWLRAIAFGAVTVLLLILLAAALGAGVGQVELLAILLLGGVVGVWGFKTAGASHSSSA